MDSPSGLRGFGQVFLGMFACRRASVTAHTILEPYLNTVIRSALNCAGYKWALVKEGEEGRGAAASKPPPAPHDAEAAERDPWGYSGSSGGTSTAQARAFDFERGRRGGGGTSAAEAACFNV